MKVLHGRAAALVAGIATVVSVAGATAVQAQPSHSTASSSAAGRAAVSVAHNRVVEHSARFGFGPGQALQAKGVITSTTGTVVRFDRTYQGLPVVGGDFTVHLTPSGAYRYGDGRTVAGLPASVTPTVSRTAAITAAKASRPYAVLASSARLAILTSPHSSALTWAVSTRGGQTADVTYVSASSGSVLRSWPTVVNDTGKGKTLYSGNVALGTTKSGSVWNLTDGSRGNQNTYDAHNTEIGGGSTLFTDSDNVWGNHQTSDRTTAGADAAYSLAETWDYYLNVFGRNGIGDDGIAARAYVHVYSNWVNASWDDSCFCMRFGDGNVAQGYTPLVSLDVGGHEMTHGVTSRTAGLVYAGESGGLNESTSDVFGTQVEWYAKNKHDVPDYDIGEQIYVNYDPAVNYLRRMDQPSDDGLSADCWYSGVGGLNVHYSSGVGNHLFYLLSEGSGKKTINGIDYNSPTCNGKSVKGIGHTEAAAIWFKALTENWTSTTNYHAARTGMLQAAADLYGKNSLEYKATNKAWAAVAVTP